MSPRICALLSLGWIPTLAFVLGVPWGEPDAAAAEGPAAAAGGSMVADGGAERTPIRVTRLYTGDDGLTHAEEIDWPLGSQRGATELSERIPVSSVQFRRTSPEYFIDWHQAPEAQFVITLSGHSEVELANGQKIELGPGHILLAEDTTGQGHISRAVGDADRISVFIPLEPVGRQGSP
jgi:hypothetical protein